jgi:ribosome biogenesis protein Tsr3
MILEPKLFFPNNEKGIIAPPTFIINEPYSQKLERQKIYENLPTTFKSKNHIVTDVYLSCIISENYQIMFRNNGKIILSCNWKQDKEVQTIQDIIDYGVVL